MKLSPILRLAPIVLGILSGAHQCYADEDLDILIGKIIDFDAQGVENEIERQPTDKAKKKLVTKKNDARRTPLQIAAKTYDQLGNEFIEKANKASFSNAYNYASANTLRTSSVNADTRRTQMAQQEKADAQQEKQDDTKKIIELLVANGADYEDLKPYLGKKGTNTYNQFLTELYEDIKKNRRKK